uniref:Cell division control protein 45-like protein n=1 Tax=Loa loa TaxID=7209 RepID=A0A1I7V8W6_LOALO
MESKVKLKKPKCHVLIIANVDADAVCASQILLDLFVADDVAYTLVPVDGWECFRTALMEHGEQAHSVVLFNCGATESLIPYLRPGMTLYVIDSRRPLDLSNVYYEDNIRLIVSRNEWEQLDIPNICDVEISDSSSSEESGDEVETGIDTKNESGFLERTVQLEEDDEANESQTSPSEQLEIARSSSDGENEVEKSDAGDTERTDDREQLEESASRRRRRISDVADSVGRQEAKRRRRMELRRHREDVLWKYHENSWYGPSSAVLMLEVAHSVGRTTVEMMWSAVVGISSQLVEYLISHDCYTTVCFDRLRAFRMKFCPDGSDIVRGDDILRLKFDDEIMLPLYAHWSLYTSMMHNDFFFCLTQMWQQSGALIMKALLAELEITLEESHQVYSALTSERKEAIFRHIYKHMDDEFASFTAHIGYSNKYNSCDFARAIAGRISYGVVEVESPYDRFIGAQEILQKFIEEGDKTPLSKAIESYKSCLTSLVNLVFMSINQSLIVSVGSFYLLCLPQEDEARILHCRHFLYIFIHYVLRAFTVSSHSKNRANRPLFVAVPMSGENTGWFLITGSMPANTDYEDSNQKSFIGRAMQKVVENFMRDGARRDFFDSAMVMIRSDQKARFFDGLQATLEIE